MNNISSTYSGYQTSMVQQAFSIETVKSSNELASQTMDTLMSGVSEMVMSSRQGVGQTIDTYA